MKQKAFKQGRETCRKNLNQLVRVQLGNPFDQHSEEHWFFEQGYKREALKIFLKLKHRRK